MRTFETETTLLKTTAYTNTMSPIDYTQIKPEFEDEFEDHYPEKPQEEQKKKQQLLKKLHQGGGGGCLKCCCIGFAIVLAVIALLLVATFTAMYMWTKNQVVRLTVDEPLPPFPIVDLTEAEVNVIKDRTDLFFDTIASGVAPPDDLVLTAHEFNGLIGHSDYLRANMYVDIQPGHFSVLMSLPADFLPGGQGRYFVETASVQNTAPHKVLAVLDALHPIPDLNDPIFMADMDVSKDENAAVNKWIAILNVGEFMGNYAPPDYISQRKNFLDDLYDDPDTAQVLNGIDSIAIEEDKIVIKATKTKNRSDFVYSPTLQDDVVTTTTRDKGARSFLRKLSFI